MPKKPKPKKNPTDPLLLARAVVEAAIGEPIMPLKSNAKPKKKAKPRKRL